MNNLYKYSPILLIVAGLIAFVFWQAHDPAQGLTMSLPGLDGRPEVDPDAMELVNIGEKFNVYTEEEESDLQGSWSRFRGVNSDNIVQEKIKLLDKWGPGGPDIKWEVSLGEGHAAPVIHKGRVYILDYHETKKADALRCFSLKTGEELWRRWYNVHVKRNHGMSRTVPAITDKYLITVGPLGHVMCVNPANGDLLWGIDLIKKYHGEVPFWYTGQCPIIENDIAVLAPGGSSLMIGVDCETGEVIWETPNPKLWKMSHSSVIPMDYNGTRMYVYAAIGGICGVQADGANAGAMLWETNEFAPAVVAPSPVQLDKGKIFITAGYGAGSMLFQLVPKAAGFNVEIIQKYKPKDGMAAEQQTPIFYKGHIYSILPKDAGSRRNEFVRCSQDDCQTITWTSGKTERYGLGPYIVADNKFYILNDDGTLAIAKAGGSKFELLDKTRVLEGQDAWGPLAIADGYLLMRDSKTMVCLDIQANR